MRRVACGRVSAAVNREQAAQVAAADVVRVQGCG